jgi:hypothetical protein
MIRRQVPRRPLFFRRSDPVSSLSATVEQLDVGDIRARLRTDQVGRRRNPQEKRPRTGQEKVDLLDAAAPGAKQHSLASSDRFSAAHAAGSAVGAIHNARGRSQVVQFGSRGVMSRFGSVRRAGSSPRWGINAQGRGKFIRRVSAHPPFPCDEPLIRGIAREVRFVGD